MGEVEHALSQGVITLHSKIKVRYKTVDAAGKPTVVRVDTTPGRMMIAEHLPRHPNVPFAMVNRVLRKPEISALIDIVYRHCGQKETVLFADAIMALGFREAYKAGISFGKDDMVVPHTKERLVEETRKLIKDYEKQYQDGFITEQEKYNKVVDAWSKCTDRVAEEMMREISSVKRDETTKRVKEINSIYMMSHSGARGSPTQMKQLAGMRGLMTKPSGEIIETPIISNFKEGLTVLEYFNSTHGARKGLADTALKTANSGYLTRRLVDVAQDCIIVADDCGTKQGITVAAVLDGGNVVATLGERTLGRTSAEEIRDPATNKVIVKRGEEITEDKVDAIESAHVSKVKIRSVLTCDLKVGVCAKCYGRDLARGTPVNSGEAVGVIAAQSIGEPGTQLTMRTFHIGGAAQVAEQSFLDASHDGKIKIVNKNAVKDSTGMLRVMGRNSQVVIVDENGQERASYKVPFGAHIRFDEGAAIKRGERVIEWDPYTIPILTEKAGYVKFEGLVEGISLQEVTDESTGISSKKILDWRSNTRGSDLRPAISVRDKKGEVIKLSNKAEARYLLPVDAILSVEDGAEVREGDILARISTEGAKTRDITGGLPRVAELFEARKPKDHAIIAEAEGWIEFGKDYKNKRRVILKPKDDKEEPIEYLIPKGKHIAVQEGDFVEKGDYILDGNPAPHDILRIRGVEALAAYLVQEIQDVYRLQGVKINDKHIEVIVRQMLQKVEIEDGGDTTLVQGEQLDFIEYEEINTKAKAEGIKPAVGKPVLLGITKASLQTRSFISAASFQETTRVLTEAAVSGKVDTLEGLKENVIVGRLIPAGTGGMMTKLKNLAADRDKAILAAREAALPAPANPSPPPADAAE
jgi:DNA-directed RNA polymerase subunit beta'